MKSLMLADKELEQKSMLEHSQAVIRGFREKVSVSLRILHFLPLKNLHGIRGKIQEGKKVVEIDAVVPTIASDVVREDRRA
ncbi:hypothetical protein LguiA_013183 [Lonicera macranthoides]